MLEEHLKTEFARKARYNARRKSYEAPIMGRMTPHCGLVARIKKRHYEHHKSNRSKRKHGTVDLCGSTSALGKRIDREIAQPANAKHHGMTKSLRAHWELNGHRIVACQVPVRVPNFPYCMTQADVMTRDNLGRLWLWEVKTGVPVGFNRKQGHLTAVDGAPVPCNWPAIWQLQLLYTERALRAAGVPVVGSRVIQIHGRRSKKGHFEVKVYEPPGWTNRVRM